MVNYGRTLRSNTTATQSKPPLASPRTEPFTMTAPSADSSGSLVTLVPNGSKLAGLSVTSLRLLRQKQAKLRATAWQPSPLHRALAATLIFAQHEAGTAVCIDRRGWLLTCAHCFGDDEAEIQANMPARRWLLFYTGAAVQVECHAYDIRRDLALLKVIAIEAGLEHPKGKVPSEAVVAEVSFCHIPLSANMSTARVPICCIGQPGRDDLESKTARKTTYDLFEVSTGSLRGQIAGDPHDNLDIGNLRHDAWTYWGHSGAPLVRLGDGSLVGLHSSWDDQTGMRHGVPLIAIRAFLQEKLPASLDQR